MNIRIYIYSLMVCLLAMACSENFNAIYYPEEEVDNNVISGDNTSKTQIQIFPSLYDAEYGISTPTRGTGPLEDWRDDQQHWMSTTFRTFAFRTNNYKGGKADYTAAEQTDACLLFDQPMRIRNVAGDVAFYDWADLNTVVKKYYHSDRMSRWKFFLLGTDDATDVRYDRKATRVTAQFEIDGKRDVLHSFAYHTDESLRKFEEKVAAMGGDNEAMHVFTDAENNHSGDLLYSGLAGSLGLHPYFNINHLLSRFDIFVLGGQNSPNNNFLQVVLDKVIVSAPNQVEVTVADDNWERASYCQAYENGELLRTLGENYNFQLDLVKRRMENNGETQKYRPNTDFSQLWQQVVAQGVYSDDALVHHVCSKDQNFVDTLARTVMLPPLQSYQLRLDGKFFICTDRDGELNLAEKDNCQSMSGGVYEIKLPDGEPFKPGCHYNVTIYVYGLNEIYVSVALASAWENGGVINIDTDRNK